MLFIYMIVYIVTNRINGKKYIGKQVRKPTSYLGSGILLIKAVKKYGKDAFSKQVLEQCRDKKHLADREKYWIKKLNAVSRSDFYNLADGGDGGFSHITTEIMNKRVNKRYGKKLVPPPGSVKTFSNKVYKVSIDGETFIGKAEECMEKFEIEYSMFYHYIKTEKQSGYKFNSIKIKELFERYYLIEGKKLYSSKEIKQQFGVTSSALDSRCQSLRFDWWKIETVKGK